MANVPLVANPIFPPVPDEPKLDIEPTDEKGQELQKTFDAIWKWMKDVSVQLKILFGSPQASNSAITIPLVQAGTVLAFGGVPANIPAGYLLCDGSQVSQTQFAALFSAIGTTWNTGGEAAGNFRVPDLRGCGVIGAGAGVGLTARSVGQKGGEESHVLVTAEIPAAPVTVTVTDPGHGHSVSDPGHSHDVRGLAVAAGAPNVSVPNNNGNTGFRTSTDGTGVSVNSGTTGITAAGTLAGGGGSHNNMAPFGVIQWMIKF